MFKWYSPVVLLALLTSFIPTIAQKADIPIGTWQEHLNYRNTIQVIKGDQIYCATQTNIFSVDAKGEMSRFSKVNGLNDIGLQSIGWDELTQQLIIAYNNSNLDILKGSIVKNIGDILRSNFTGNKKINHTYCRNGLAYLSTGLGIIVVDLQRYEIKDTWVIGTNGAQIGINGLVADNNFFYAATNEGLKRASVNAPDLSNYTNWTLISRTNGLSNAPVQFTGIGNNILIVQKNDSLFSVNNSQWGLLYTDTLWPISNTTISNNKILVSQRTASGNARVIQLNTTGTIEKTILQSGVISAPQSAIIDNNSIWVADLFGGLSNFGTIAEQFIPNGPLSPSSGEFAFTNNTLYQAAGSVNTAWNYLFNREGIFNFTDGIWNFKGAVNTPLLDTVRDFISLAIDPTNKTLWAGSYGGGLVQFEATKTTIYKQFNSPIQAAIGDASSYRISGLAFDNNNNLWISNYGAPQPLKLRKQDGTWKSFSIPFSLTENAVAQLVTDDYNQLWIMSPKNNGLICYNYGASVDNSSDDRWKLYQQGAGNGNLPSNNILSIVKDKNSSIWVGTDDGIGIINCTNDIFGNGGCDATLPIVQQDQFAGLLFKGEQVQCMAVDGANRKWIGTQNGVWLLSDDGKKIIFRFTAANSPLLNNDIKKIGINPISGEVYFATFSGICSFRGTATEANNQFTDVLVYPNPVPPGYNGTIAIKGLTENAIVKITELTGRLVFQTRSLGGQAIWNGRDYLGNKIASGIYLVIARNDAGDEKIVTKIVITSGR